MSEESQDAVVEAPAETDEEIQSEPSEQVESEEVASTDADVEEHLEAAGEAPAEEAEAPAPEPAESEAPQDSGKPFSFRADGVTVDVPGAGLYDHDDGSGNPAQSLVIPADSWQRYIQPRLADRGTIAKQRQDLERQIEQLDPKNNETVVRAQSLLDNFEQIISSPEALTEFLEGFDQNKEMLKLKADIAARDAADGMRTSAEETQASADREAEVYQQIDQDITVSASGVFDALGLDISDTDKERIGRRLWDRRHDFYRYATEEDVRQHPDVSVGQVVCDYDRIEAEIRYGASASSPGPGQTDKTKKARQKNEAALNPKDPPKTVPADGSPAPSKSKAPDFKTREEYEEWLDA